MASIRERGGQWHVQVRMSGYPARTASFPTKRLAERWAKTIEASMIEGRHFTGTEARRRSVGEAIDKYQREALPALKDVRNVAAKLAWWKAAAVAPGKTVADLRLSDLTAEVIDAQIAELRKESPETGRPRSAKTINRYLAALSRVCTLARKRWRWMTQNPFEQIERTKEDKGRTRTLTGEQRARLLAAVAADTSPDGLLLDLLVRIALGSVTRAGELLKLQWADVDLETGRLTLRDTKNGETRTAFVFGNVLERLQAHKQRAANTGRCADGALVFQSNRYSDKPRAFAYRRHWQRACKAAGLPAGIVYHSLRHQAATDLGRAGATEQQLKALGGWKSNVVAKYVHLAAEDARHIAEKMNAETFGQKENARTPT